MGKVVNFFRRLSRAAPGSVPGNHAPLVDEEALAFFNSLSATLEIELTEPAQPVGGLLNPAAPPSAQIASLRLEAEVFDNGTDTGRPLTQAELDRVVLVASTLTLRNDSGENVSHQVPEGRRLTVGLLLHAVEETERSTRGTTEWLGGIDVHHIYFEGIHPAEDGVWEIYWGS